MCDLMWRQLIQQNPEIFKFITWTPDDEPMRVPEKGKIDTGMENFQVIPLRINNPLANSDKCSDESSFILMILSWHGSRAKLNGRFQ